jgi:hypothetical protein
MDGDDYDLYLDSYVEAPEAVPLEVAIKVSATVHIFSAFHDNIPNKNTSPTC